MNQKLEHLSNYANLLKRVFSWVLITTTQTQLMSSRSPYGGLANLAKFKGFKSAVDEDVSDETMRAQLRFDRSLNQPRPMKLSSADIQLIDEKLYANAESDPISLFDLLNEDRVPSLDARLTLVRALTEAILEKLHAVDWLGT